MTQSTRRSALVSLVFLVVTALVGGPQPGDPVPVQATEIERRSPFVPAQPSPVSESATTLDSLLQPDGTIDLTRGFAGSVKADGWALAESPSGAPRFVRRGADDRPASRVNAVPDDAYWDDGFGPPGPEQEVLALAISGGDLYLGGKFEVAGSLQVNRVVKWSSAQATWQALGMGLSDVVNTLLISGTDVIAGGEFIRACDDTTCLTGPRVNRIARFRSGAWEPMGNGLNSQVFTLALNPAGVLFAGGAFNRACLTLADCLSGPAANGIATFSDAGWQQFACGVNGTVRTIAFRGNDVYLGGYIPQAYVKNGNSCLGSTLGTNHVTKYDALAGEFVQLGYGLSNQAKALLVRPSGELVALGDFRGACFQQVCDDNNGFFDRSNYIARFDPAQPQKWLPLGNGVSGPIASAVLSGTVVYATGVFTGSCQTDTCSGADPLRYLGRLDLGNSAWSPVGEGIGYRGAVVVLDGPDPVVGGDFVTALDSSGVKPTGRVVRYRNGAWAGYGMGNGLLTDGGPGSVTALAIAGDLVYVGGLFKQAGNLAVNNVAVWNDRTRVWLPLGFGLDGSVFALAIGPDGLVYAGGNFVWACGDLTCANGTRVNRLAKFTGSTWAPVDLGVNGQVFALAFLGNVLYVGGGFSGACTVLACGVGQITASNGIARYDPATGWSGLAAGFTAPVNAIAARSATEIYAGGGFENLCLTASPCTIGPRVNSIARFDGLAWQPLDFGLSGGVATIVLSDTQVFVGGVFSGACLTLSCTATNRLNYVGRYTPASGWTPLAQGLDESVESLGLRPEGIVATGNFQNTCQPPNCTPGQPVSQIARFSQGAWSPIGSGVGPVSGIGLALASKGGDLFVGGEFWFAGGKPSAAIARYSAQADLSVVASAPATVTVGSSLQHTIAVSNSGPGAAYQTAISFTISGGTALAISSPGGACTGLTCAFGTLGTGASVTVTVTYTASVAGVITTTVIGGAVQQDPAGANNIVSVGTLVVAQPGGGGGGGSGSSFTLYLPVVANRQQ